MKIFWVLTIFNAFWLLPTVHFMYADGDVMADKPTKTRAIIVALICICIITLGGMPVGSFIGYMLDQYVEPMSLEETIGEAIGIGCIPALLTYWVGFNVINLKQIKSKLLHIVFVIVFITSTVLWTIPTTNYHHNIVVEKQTSVTNTVEYDLYYFCNIPVQKISGNMDSTLIVGSGNISGNISTYDTLPYWYDSGNGDALYDSVNADDSKIVFTENGETPFVRVITYRTQEVEMNNNNGEQSVLNENWWEVYEFHVPSEIMQYNIG